MLPPHTAALRRPRRGTAHPAPTCPPAGSRARALHNSHGCICDWENDGTHLSCAELSARHEFGTATHRLPLDRDIARRYLERLNVDPDEWEGLMDENEQDEDGRGVRYSHLHHHPADRRLTAGGRATVDLSSRTNFRDDQRDLRQHGSPPQPSRPRGGQTGVEESPSKFGTPADAEAKRKREEAKRVRMAELGDGESPEPEGQPARAAASEQEEVVEEPGGFKAGTGLATIEQTIELAQMCEAHGRECDGTIHWSTRDCTFVGVVMSVGGYCRDCGQSFRWYSSPPAVEEESPEEEEEEEEEAARPAAGSLYLNKLVSLALLTTPGVVEQKKAFMQALDLSVPASRTLDAEMAGECTDAVMKAWEEEQATLIEAAETEGGGKKMLLSLDGSHTGTADGKGTLSTVNALDNLNDGKVVWSKVTDQGGPAGREHRLGQELLEWVEENEVDVPALVIDESSLQSVVKATVRQAQLELADDDSDEKCMQVILDIVRPRHRHPQLPSAPCSLARVRSGTARRTCASGWTPGRRAWPRRFRPCWIGSRRRPRAKASA